MCQKRDAITYPSLRVCSKQIVLPTTHINMYNKNCIVNCMYCKFPRINDSWFLRYPLLLVILYNQKKRVSHGGISNCIPWYSVGCNYLSLPKTPPSGIEVLIYGSVNTVIIVLCKGSSHVWCQAITWINADILSMGTHRNKLKWNLNQYIHFFTEEISY